MKEFNINNSVNNVGEKQMSRLRDIIFSLKDEVYKYDGNIKFIEHKINELMFIPVDTVVLSKSDSTDNDCSIINELTAILNRLCELNTRFNDAKKHLDEII